MANQEHLDVLAQGVEVWLRWRQENSEVKPDFSNANFNGANLITAYLCDADFEYASLERADLSQATLIQADFNKASLAGANLCGANLMDAYLELANLTGADLTDALLNDAILTGADCRGANFVRANLSGANLSTADLTAATLNGVDLSRANLVETNLERADITDCSIYAINAWNVKLDGATQSNLNLSRSDEPTITVDDLEVAQFIHLLLNNRKIRNVINTITSKAVLILGRFTPERKIVLEALWGVLRGRNYLPILFDFDKPSGRNLTETVSTLAHMARFVIADITSAKSIPQELQRIVPHLPSLPVQPLLLASEYEYAMFKDFIDYPWVLAPYRYETVEELLRSVEEKVIAPAVAKAKEIEDRRLAYNEGMAK
jgi:uncharacterized protein YjbI with pentapeptide repeats